METTTHTMSSLFEQLGLPSDEGAIATFIARHSPLCADVRLDQAPFWNPTQAGFLRDSVLDDADWSEVIDTLDSELRAPFSPARPAD